MNCDQSSPGNWQARRALRTVLDQLFLKYIQDRNGSGYLIGLITIHLRKKSDSLWVPAVPNSPNHIKALRSFLDQLFAKYSEYDVLASWLAVELEELEKAQGQLPGVEKCCLN